MQQAVLVSEFHLSLEATVLKSFAPAWKILFLKDVSWEASPIATAKHSPAIRLNFEKIDAIIVPAMSVLTIQTFQLT